MMLLSVHANAWTTVAEFESAVAEALTNKTALVEVAFTNQLMSYSQNADDLNSRLSADIIRGVCEMALSVSLKAFAEKLSVPYAFQVAVDAEGSKVNPLDYEGRPVKLSFLDLAKILI